VGGLVAMLEGRLGPDHQMTLNALSAQANLGGDVGDQTGRVEAIQRVLASYDRQGRTDEALMAALGLAMAQSDAGNLDDALRTYESALSRARRPEQRSQVLRNWGLALKEAGRSGPAEQRLTEAVTQARLGGDGELLGRARIALGLFLQHEERLGDARTVIEEGLAVLDPVHPDAMIGRSHLSAVLDGRSCGCGDLGTTIEAAFREFVLAKVPGDLLAGLSVKVEDGDFRINVELSREPGEEELERLNGVVQSAYAEFRRRLSARE
jgi:tetratricopeptide (TPR) repeat protein